MFTESVSSIVYHFTSLRKAYNIIVQGEFRLSPTFIHPSNVETRFSKNYYYLSTTRSKLGNFHQSEHMGAMFKLDGDKINRNHKGIAVDYYADLGGSKEMEDRIISNKSTLPFKNNVLSIDILLSEEYMTDIDARIAFFIYVYGKKNGIPVLVYTNRRAFINSDKRKALSYDIIKTFKNGETIPSFEQKRHQLKELIGLYHKPYHKLNKEELTVRNEIIKNPDFKYSIRTDLDSQVSSLGGKSYIKKIGEILKKEKMRSYVELLNLLRERFIHEDEKRQMDARKNAATNNYNKNKALHNHIIKVLDGDESFDRSYFNGIDDELLIMHIDKIIRTLEQLNLISPRAKLVWYDEYGISEDAYRTLFNIDV